jgi:hypothetical protein
VSSRGAANPFARSKSRDVKPAVTCARLHNLKERSSRYGEWRLQFGRTNSVCSCLEFRHVAEPGTALTEGSIA